jgi:hypothetical protein
LISRTSAIPHDSADRGWSEARLEHSPLDAAFTLRSALEPILDGLPTGPLPRLPDVAIPAGRTRACRCRAFVSYPGSCAPAVHHAAAGNRGVTAHAASIRGSSWPDAGKGNREQNCKHSHALLLQNPRRISIAHRTAFAGLSSRRGAPPERDGLFKSWASPSGRARAGGG